MFLWSVINQLFFSKRMALPSLHTLMWLIHLIDIIPAQHRFPLDDSGPGFQRLANSPAYIDKTLSIEEFLEHSGNARLITAPAGFGKSLHLRMLQDFFQIPLNKNGSEIPKEWSTAFKIFRSKKIGHSKFLDDFGTRGVVFFDLTVLYGFDNIAEYFAKFRNVLEKAFKQHMYLIQNARSELDFSLNRQVFERCGVLDPYLRINSSTLEVCGSELVQLVQTHFRRRVLLLIDAVSAPFEWVLSNPNTNVWTTKKDCDLDCITDSLQLFISSLVKGNHQVWRSYLTAITGFDMPHNESINNVEFASIFTSRKLAVGFGFTQSELEELTTIFGMNSEHKIVLQRYLKGYSIYQNDESEDVGPIYCPGFVAEYLGEGRGRPRLTPDFAVDYSSLRRLNPFKNLLSPKLFGNQIIRSLKPNTEIQIKNISKIPFKDLMLLREAEITGATKHLKKIQDYFLFYLVEHGYYTGKYIGEKLSIKISNKIARLSLRHEITKIEYYREYLGCSDTAIQEFSDSIDSFDGTQKALDNVKSLVTKTFHRGLVAKLPESELEISAPIYSFLVRSNNANESITDYDDFGDIFVPVPKISGNKTTIIHPPNEVAGLDVTYVKRKNGLGILFGTEFDKEPNKYDVDESYSTAQQILKKMVAMRYYTYFAKDRFKRTALISIHMNLTHVSCCSLYNSFDINSKSRMKMMSS
ncbi:unnamed protein product [Bemisia tabaci]|uniref:AAA-ATPase-like domain-containing protein n=2 Tax=Bemisia tabaci TaxID=7038 RepID=A0A9P0ANA8_BEMTA|nr:unnamed protein product [Bemisia tabaci]